MESPEENHNWVFDLSLMDDIPVSAGDFPCLEPGFRWPGNTISPLTGVEYDNPFHNSESAKEFSSRKRARPGPCSASDSKAHREKIRRDRLNDRFQELSSLLDPERPPKLDKSVILTDAARMVVQLRDEAEKLKESCDSLQKKVDELKAEKNELRDEKQKLRAEKDILEQQVKVLSSQPGFYPQLSAIPSPFAAQPHVFGSKLMPFVGYSGTPMWHFVPPASVDTSEDHVLRPPVA